MRQGACLSAPFRSFREGVDVVVSEYIREYCSLDPIESIFDFVTDLQLSNEHERVAYPPYLFQAQSFSTLFEHVPPEPCDEAIQFCGTHNFRAREELKLEVDPQAIPTVLFGFREILRSKILGSNAGSFSLRTEGSHFFVGSSPKIERPSWIGVLLVGVRVRVRARAVSVPWSLMSITSNWYPAYLTRLL